MLARHQFFAAILLSLLSGCAVTKGPPPIGEAYVGPVTLNIRQEIAPKSAVVATVKHGEKLDVLQARRRFLKVRTPAGATGWTDSRQLLSTGQMDELRKLAADAAKLPSQGSATVYEPLNVHTDPTRTSVSFAQIPEASPVQVIGHRVTPRLTGPLPSKPVIALKPPPPPRRKKKVEARRPLAPPMPAPPPVPSNWLELSRSYPLEPGAEEEFARQTASESAKQEKEEADDKPVAMDDWNLVRMKDGRTGWVLSKMLKMSIPDDVAVYAEGHRITSYFALADLKDDEGNAKHYWLWTTIRGNAQPYQFDAFRVFVWRIGRHRYETIYQERRVKGYYPVEARKGNDRGEGATFSLIIEEDDGKVFRKSFVVKAGHVIAVNSESYQLPATEAKSETASTAVAPAGAPPAPEPDQTVLEKLKKRAKSILKR